MHRKFLFIFLLFLSSHVIGQNVNVPLDYWGYRFLDRLETKGLFKTHDLRTRPISRKTFAELVRTAQKAESQHPNLFSRTERQLFDQMQSDFRDELAQTGLNVQHLRHEPHLLKWAEPHGKAYFDLYGRQSIISNRGEQYQPDDLLSETTMGGILRGSLDEHAGFYVDARNAVTRGSDVKDESFDLSKGSPVVTSGPNVIRDRAIAYFIFGKPWARLELGRDEIDWGPAFHGGLTVTRNMPPAEMIRFSSRFKRFTFTSAHAFLSSSLGPKYLAAHRIDLTIIPGFYFGGSETVIYGGRDVEFAYLNPIMPYHVAEHHLGDRDNNTLSFDVTTTLIPSVKLYGEYFIDDMTSTKSLTKYFGNKFAFLVGGYWVDPLKIRNIDLRFEYARVEPFVYTHWDSINIYTHYDKIIGHWLGPNSENVFFQIGYQLSRDLRFELNLERIRKGVGRADTHSRPDVGDEKHFLGGIVENRKLAGLKLTDQIRRDFFISVSYTYSDSRNLAQIQGRKSYDHLARFVFYFNY